jgi:hypothetical protein
MRAFSIIGSAVLGILVLSGSAFAQQKTVKACQQEWRANKAANQAAGVTEKAYVTQCRSGATATTQAPAAAPAPAPTPSAQRAPAAPAQQVAPAAPATGSNQFTTEAQAKARCPAGMVVWANLPSKIYHFAGTRDYGHTKRGAYMCEQDAQTAGMRAAKNEKHP